MDKPTIVRPMEDRLPKMVGPGDVVFQWPQERSCAKCGYSEQVVSPVTLDVEIYCRRYPPQLVYVSQLKQLKTMPLPVSATNWCYEFKLDKE